MVFLHLSAFLILLINVTVATDYTQCPGWWGSFFRKDPYRLLTQEDNTKISSGILNGIFAIPDGLQRRSISSSQSLTSRGWQEERVPSVPNNATIADIFKNISPEQVEKALELIQTLQGSAAADGYVSDQLRQARNKSSQLVNKAVTMIKESYEKAGHAPDTSDVAFKIAAGFVNTALLRPDLFDLALSDSDKESLMRLRLDLDKGPPPTAVQPRNAVEISLGTLNGVYNFAQACQSVAVLGWKMPKFLLDKDNPWRERCGYVVAWSAAAQLYFGALVLMHGGVPGVGRRANNSPTPFALNIKVQIRGRRVQGIPDVSKPPVTQFMGDKIPAKYAKKWINNARRCTGMKKRTKDAGVSPESLVAPRDDVDDGVDSAMNYDDLENVIWSLIWMTFFPAVQSGGPSTARYSLARHGHSSVNDINNGGLLLIDLWLSDEPDVARLATSFSPQDLQSWSYTKGTPAQGQECYDVYVPDNTRVTRDYDGTPTKHWTFAFADACKNVIGKREGVARDFQYTGRGYSANVGNTKKKRGDPHQDPQEPDTENGLGFSGKYHADGCQEKIKCADIVGSNGDGLKGDLANHFGVCKAWSKDHWYHGGIFHHVLPDGKKCGWWEIKPLGEAVPEFQTPKPSFFGQ